MAKSPGTGQVPAESVRQALARLLANEHFSRAQALTHFLSHTVEQTLQGREDGLKEYVIGLEVFGRGQHFDPRIDPIVRVQAGKLRTRLKKYYETDGVADPVVIEFPKGGYIPVFRPRISRPQFSPPAAGRRPIPRSLGLGLAGAVAIALLAAAAIRFWPSGGSPPVAASLSLTRLTYDPGSTSFPAISRDGKWIVYASSRGGKGELDLWIQPARRGEAAQLTRHAAADLTPDLSPDGTQIVFRSNRDGGGLYAIPVLGGTERRIADSGWRPRFSPDGSRIVFQSGSPRPGGDLYLIAASGGEPRRIDIGRNVELGGSPIWTPGGRYLLFLGSDLRANRAWDWWVAPPDGGLPKSTGVAAVLARQGLPPLNIHSVPGDWAGNEIVFSLVREQAANLWSIPFAPATWRASGPARQITSGTANETMPRVSQGGLLVFVSESRDSHLYELPRQPRNAAVEPVRLTNDLALDVGFFRALTRFSADDDYLAFPSNRKGNADIFVKNLGTGTESPVTANPEPEDQPLLAPDRAHIAYRSRESGANRIYLTQIGTQVARKICEDCGEPNSWTADGRRLLYTSRGGLGLLDIETGRKTELARIPGVTIRHAGLSPNQRQLALTVEDSAHQGERAFLAPFAGQPLPAEDQWIEVLKDFGVESLHWSPDGASLYFFSPKDDFRCLWRQELGPGTLPKGEPVAIAHFHDNRRSPWSSWLAVTPNRIFFSLTEPNSSLWTVQLGPPR
jgi:Tol biopolymer transport system component